MTDPLGNTEGDATTPLTKDFANQGGNSMFTTWALAGWQGAALESALPYDTLSTTAQLPDSLGIWTGLGTYAECILDRVRVIWNPSNRWSCNMGH